MVQFLFDSGCKHTTSSFCLHNYFYYVKILSYSLQQHSKILHTEAHLHSGLFKLQQVEIYLI